MGSEMGDTKVGRAVANAFWHGVEGRVGGDSEVFVQGGYVYLSVDGYTVARRPIRGRRLEIDSNGFPRALIAVRLNAILGGLSNGSHLKLRRGWYFIIAPTIHEAITSPGWVLVYPGDPLEQLGGLLDFDR